mmetsp:Transcript_7778/g.21299  ORF Transcript_7778/g.21299 Transcript_7778/m.21299 type:complete len:238 (-) Transcript_7778:36-749(-)
MEYLRVHRLGERLRLNAVEPPVLVFVRILEELEKHVTLSFIDLVSELRHGQFSVVVLVEILHGDLERVDATDLLFPVHGSAENFSLDQVQETVVIGIRLIKRFSQPMFFIRLGGGRQFLERQLPIIVSISHTEKGFDHRLLSIHGSTKDLRLELVKPPVIVGVCAPKGFSKQRLLRGRNSLRQLNEGQVRVTVDIESGKIRVDVSGRNLASTKHHQLTESGDQFHPHDVMNAPEVGK